MGLNCPDNSAPVPQCPKDSSDLSAELSHLGDQTVPPRGPKFLVVSSTASTCRHCSHNCGRVYVTVRCPSVGPSVCFIYRSLQKRAAGLLLWARRTGDTDRQRRPSGAEQQGAQQHGVQQQMRAVPRCQLT